MRSNVFCISFGQIYGSNSTFKIVLFIIMVTMLCCNGQKTYRNFIIYYNFLYKQCYQKQQLQSVLLSLPLSLLFAKEAELLSRALKSVFLFFYFLDDTKEIDQEHNESLSVINGYHLKCGKHNNRIQLVDVDILDAGITCSTSQST